MPRGAAMPRLPLHAPFEERSNKQSRSLQPLRIGAEIRSLNPHNTTKILHFVGIIIGIGQHCDYHFEVPGTIADSAELQTDLHAMSNLQPTRGPTTSKHTPQTTYSGNPTPIVSTESGNSEGISTPHWIPQSRP